MFKYASNEINIKYHDNTMCLFSIEDLICMLL